MKEVEAEAELGGPSWLCCHSVLPAGRLTNRSGASAETLHPRWQCEGGGMCEAILARVQSVPVSAVGVKQLKPRYRLRGWVRGWACPAACWNGRPAARTNACSTACNASPRPAFLQRVQRGADAAFIEMLRALPPPGVTVTTSYDQVEAACGVDPRWQALAEPRRRAALDAMKSAMARAAAQARAQVGGVLAQ